MSARFVTKAELFQASTCHTLKIRQTFVPDILADGNIMAIVQIVSWFGQTFPATLCCRRRMESIEDGIAKPMPIPALAVGVKAWEETVKRKIFDHPQEN